MASWVTSKCDGWSGAVSITSMCKFSGERPSLVHYRVVNKSASYSYLVWIIESSVPNSLIYECFVKYKRNCDEYIGVYKHLVFLGFQKKINLKQFVFMAKPAVSRKFSRIRPRKYLFTSKQEFSKAQWVHDETSLFLGHWLVSFQEPTWPATVFQDLVGIHVGRPW